MELKDTHLNELPRLWAEAVSGCSTRITVAQYETNRKHHRDTEVGENESIEDTDTFSEELYEEQYWEQSGCLKKANKSKQKTPVKLTCEEINDNFITYRKTWSKDQKERQMHMRYKLDKSTTRLLEKLTNVRNVDQYHDAIGEGRNSIVISVGETVIGQGTKYLYRSFKNAIKMYKLSSDEATNKAIFQRTQREFERLNNLLRHAYCGGCLPYPVCYSKNVLVMERIGADKEPPLPMTMVPRDINSELDSILTYYLKWMYRANCVHGNISAKKFLYWHKTLYVVGWSQAVHLDHPDALKKLMRDCYFVNKFCKRIGVPVKTTEELFKDITKLKEISKEVLDVINKKHLYKKKPSTNNSSGANKPHGNDRFK